MLQADFGNYIDDNPKMVRPPRFVLQRLHDFDADLVMLPSRQTPYAYVLARRARLSGQLTPKGVYDRHNDSGMCASYGLVPVCLIFKSGPGWEVDNIIRDLAARDIWAHGGAEQAANLLDQQDAKWAAARRAENRDDMYNRSGDAWRSYQARTGQRTKLNRPQTRKQAARTQPAPSGSTAGSGLVITG